MTSAYYLAKKNNQFYHISDLCGLSELQGAVPGNFLLILWWNVFTSTKKIASLSNITSTAAAGAAGNND